MTYRVSPPQHFAPASGATVTIQPSDENILAFIEPATALATLTIVLPAMGQYDGQRITIVSAKALTIVTMSTTASGGITSAATSFLLNGFGSWAWNGVTFTWQKVG